MLPIDLLQGFEKKLALIQNRPHCPVDVEVFNEAYKDIVSVFRPAENRIIFNEHFFNHGAEIEIMGALFHEIRHAYQYHVVNHPEYADESDAVIKQWASDFKNYQAPITLDILQPSFDPDDDLAEERRLIHEELLEIARLEKQYKKPFDYLTSSIEVDALAYADLNIFNIYKIHLDVPIEMKSLVKDRQEEIKHKRDIIRP